MVKPFTPFEDITEEEHSSYIDKTTKPQYSLDIHSDNIEFSANDRTRSIYIMNTGWDNNQADSIYISPGWKIKDSSKLLSMIRPGCIVTIELEYIPSTEAKEGVFSFESVRSAGKKLIVLKLKEAE